MTETWWMSRDYAGYIKEGLLTLLDESRFRLCRENLKRLREQND